MWRVAAAALIVMPAFKADAEFVALLAAAERVTHTLMVPAMYKLCLIEPTFAGGRRCPPGAWAATAARRCRPQPSTTLSRSALPTPSCR
jgi:long-chain acyl-CoA synthetase